MRRHIEHLRSKPEHVKRRIAFLASLGVTVLIFIFWAASFTLQITSDDPVAAGGAVADSAQPDSPASVLSASAKDAYDQIKDIFDTVPNKK